MDQSVFKERIEALNDLIRRGATVEAMEEFYAESVSMQENEEEPRQGKYLCIAHEKKILRRMKSTTSKLLNQAIDHTNFIVFSEWEHHFTTIEDKSLSLTEVSIQHWESGKIVKEKFFYKEMKYKEAV